MKDEEEKIINLIKQFRLVNGHITFKQELELIAMIYRNLAIKLQWKNEFYKTSNEQVQQLTIDLFLKISLKRSTKT